MSARVKIPVAQDDTTVNADPVAELQFDPSTGATTLVFPDLREEPADPPFTIAVTPATTVADIIDLYNQLVGMMP